MNPVRYAVLQTTLEPPSVDQLRKAFTAVRCLTDSDAHTLAADAFGILVRNLSQADATQLQRALREQKVETELVPQSLLPGLPPTKYVQKLEFGTDALLIFDPVGRRFPVEWKHLSLVAAGAVELTEFERRESTRLRPELLRESAAWGAGPGILDTTREVKYRETRRQRLLLEFHLGRAVARYSIQADEGTLLASVLGEQKTGDLPQDFTALVREFLLRAPQALTNRGAFQARSSPGALFHYPTRNAFFEEITWILWRARASERHST